MARKKSTIKRKSRKRSDDSRLQQLRWWVADRVDLTTARHFAITVAWLALAGGGIYAWTVGVPMLEQRVAAASIDEAESDLPPQVVFTQRPAWMGEQLHDMLRRTAQSRLTRDPLADHQLVAARDALLETRCFAEVHQVARRSADLVEVDATFLEPFAIVVHNRSNLLIDPAGRLLPSTVQPGDGASFIRIDDVRFNPPALAGQRWDGQDIIAAIQLITQIEQRPWRDQVAALNMSGVADGGPIAIVTDSGCRIIWRSQPGMERPGEVSATEKLRRLDWMYTQWGDIDGGYSGELEISQPHPAVVHRQR